MLLSLKESEVETISGSYLVSFYVVCFCAICFYYLQYLLPSYRKLQAGLVKMKKKKERKKTKPILKNKKKG
jgi:hypothetical protein